VRIRRWIAFLRATDGPVCFYGKGPDYELRKVFLRITSSYSSSGETFTPGFLLPFASQNENSLKLKESGP